MCRVTPTLALNEVRAREIQSFAQNLEKIGPHYFKTQFPIFDIIFAF